MSKQLALAGIPESVRTATGHIQKERRPAGAVFTLRLTDETRGRLEHRMLLAGGPTKLGPWLVWCGLHCPIPSIPAPAMETERGTGPASHLLPNDWTWAVGDGPMPGQLDLLPLDQQAAIKRRDDTLSQIETYRKDPKLLATLKGARLLVFHGFAFGSQPCGLESCTVCGPNRKAGNTGAPVRTRPGIRPERLRTAAERRADHASKAKSSSKALHATAAELALPVVLK